MKRIALAASCLALVAASPASAATPTADEARVLGAQAYDYGFPLMDLLRIRREETSVRCPDAAGNSPVNSFSHAATFARPQDRIVVAPNTDTLYSLAHLDLSKGPIVLSHPAMGKRFYDFEFVDPWTNVLGYIGSRTTGQKAGDVAIVWSKGKAKAPNGVGKVIRSDYKRVWVIGRTLAGGKADQAKAHKLMRRYKLASAAGRSRTFPKGCKPGDPKRYPTPTDGAVFMARLNNAMAQNPPPARDKPFLAELRQFGVGPGLKLGSSTLPTDVRVAFYEGATAEAASLPGKVRLTALTTAIGNGGWYNAPSNIGRFGTDYEFRAIVASAGIGANTVEEATYPVAITDSAGALFNGAANRYRLTFAPGQAPPARYFWSLTMYDTTGFLTENAIKRYSVGPSHPPLVKRADGSVVIAIQHEAPAESDVNWLPAPATGFRLNLRLYGPSKAALNGTWQPPSVERLP